jgi:ADP-ribose pyrophosphatase YjhB (NUDIX family)
LITRASSITNAIFNSINLLIRVKSSLLTPKFTYFMVWKPHVTVAAIIEREQHFLLVEENTPYGLQFNQPAGHLEEHEDLITAIKREVLEETAWNFTPEYISGVHLWRRNPNNPTFVRFCFVGQCYDYQSTQALDTGIVATHWLTRDEVATKSLRSPLVLSSIDDYLSGQNYPLSLLKSFLDYA